MNQFSEWNRGDAYLRRDMLFAEEKLLEGRALREILNVRSCYEVKIHPYDAQRVKSFDLEDMMIVAVLSTGKYMTLSQLMAYLLLRGCGEMDWISLEMRMSMLQACGVVGEYEFMQAGKTANGSKDREIASVYTATWRGTKAGRALGAHPHLSQEDAVMAAQMGKKAAVVSCLLWNQVLINQLLYRGDIGSFRIQEMVPMARWRTMCIPLSINYKDKSCIFDYTSAATGPSMLCERLDMWAEYARRRNRYFTLVLMCESEMHEQWIDGCLDGFRDEHIVVATTSAKDWLHTKAGTVSYRHVAL